MAKRLPFPGHFGEDPLSDPKPDAERTAKLYLNWVCERDGIEQPELSGYRGYGHKITLSFYEDRAVFEEYIPESHSYKGRKLVRVPPCYETILEVPLPPWAIPTKRADLWHAAHQAGAPPGRCYEIANCSRWDKKEFALLLEAAVPVKTPARDKEATLEAQLAQPARMAKYLEEQHRRLEAYRAELERSNREVRRRWFEEDWNKLEERGYSDADDQPGLAELIRQENRNKWFGLAKTAREYGYAADVIKEAVCNAWKAHRDFMQMRSQPA